MDQKREGLMKTTIAAIVALLVVGVEARDLTTPSSRLIGHWTRDVRGGTMHEYFGPLDPATETGPYAWVEPSGRVVKHRYKVLAEIPGGTDLTIQILFTAGGTRSDRYDVARDGTAFTGQRQLTPSPGEPRTAVNPVFREMFRYADEKTAP